MKKLILAAIALTTAAGVYAQGTVAFGNRISGGAGSGLTLHIWGPSSSNPGLSLIGLGSNDVNATQAGLQGNIDFTANGMVMIGAGGSGGKYGYSTTFSQLIGEVGGTFGSPGLSDSLQPVGTTSTFKSGSALGGINGITETLSGSVPIPSDTSAASFEIVAWDNSSNLYPTWSSASMAWEEGLIAAGHSAPFVTTAIGGTLNLPPLLNNGRGNANLMTSFNLYFIPEPSTFALAGLGAAALLVFRRRN